MEFVVTGAGIAKTLLVICAGLITTYLVITLSNLIRTLKNINALLEANRKNIDDTISTLPEICSNINYVTKSVKGKTDMVDNFISHADEAAATTDLENLISSISTVIGLFSELKDLFTKKKKKNF
jgi:uncharacterized protein YoxC